MSQICGIVCNCGPNLEPLACGYRQGHAGPHAWSTLPTFGVSEPAKPLPRPFRILDDGYGVGGTMGRRGRSFPFDQPRGGYPYRRD